MNIEALGLIGAGLVLLVAGAEALVRGASWLAAAAGISPLIIGLTVVAYGTSAPEMAVSLQANLSGQAGISVGNVVGSNIFNVLFILGFSAAFAPLVVAQQLVKLDVPIMIGVSVLMLLLGLDQRISRLDGTLLVIGGVVYTAFLIIQSRREHDAKVQDEYAEQYGRQSPPSSRQWVTNVGFILGGLALLIWGSRWLVAGAIAIAQDLGVSELVIGLTIIAAGTSLPEAATSFIASIRGQRDIAVGNVVGSNIFNILAVLGMAGIVSPNGVAIDAPALRFDIPVMIAVAIACLPIFFSGNVISRWEGLLFLGYYSAYTTYLILDASNHENLPVFSAILLFFVISITLITLITVMVRQTGRSRN
ncbi:MAG TPA: calcium/sodium antiporter [Elainellaceae cyanobacterium]